MLDNVLLVGHAVGLVIQRNEGRADEDGEQDGDRNVYDGDSVVAIAHRDESSYGDDVLYAPDDEHEVPEAENLVHGSGMAEGGDDGDCHVVCMGKGTRHRLFGRWVRGCERW